MPIQSVNRAMDILFLFSQARPRMGVTEISKVLGLNKGTAFGLVDTLYKRGFLVKDPESQKYGLGSKLFELGAIQAWNTQLYKVGVYPVHRLSEKVGRSARLFSWEKENMLLILNVFHSSEQFPFGGAFGPSFPAYCTGAGKAILAWLPEPKIHNYIQKTQLRPYTSNTISERKALELELRKIRRNGFSTDREEFLNGFNCIGAPILDFNRCPVGSVSISVDSDFFNNQEAGSEAKELMFTAMEISRSMGYVFDGQSSMPSE